MARSRRAGGNQVPGQEGAPSVEPSEDEGLGRWVRAVVLRWTATGVSARDRANLFADLLHDLVVARARGTLARRLLDTAPGPFADRLAQQRASRASQDIDDAGRSADSTAPHP